MYIGISFEKGGMPIRAPPTYKDAYRDVYMHLLKAHIAYRDLLVIMMMLMGMPIGDLLLLIRLPIRMAISSLYGCLSGSPTANKVNQSRCPTAFKDAYGSPIAYRDAYKDVLREKGMTLWFFLDKGGSGCL